MRAKTVLFVTNTEQTDICESFFAGDQLDTLTFYKDNGLVTLQEVLVEEVLEKEIVVSNNQYEHLLIRLDHLSYWNLKQQLTS